MRARLSLLFLAALACLGPLASPASAVAPTITATYAAQVTARSASLRAEVDPKGKSSSFHFDYLTEAAYQANLAASKDPFAGASRAPASGEANVFGTAPTTIERALPNLDPSTSYRYQLAIKNADGTTNGPAHLLTTYSAAPFALPDGRGWELVSPVGKNGGQIAAPGALAGGGALQAAADGQSVTYGSASSFAGGPGAPFASQYLSTRTASGWATQNISPPIFSGSYDTEQGGAPYRIFSADLARGLLSNGKACRGEGTGCPVANPPLAGTDAPAGFQNLYLRQSATGSLEALLGNEDIAGRGLGPADFELAFAGASADLQHTVFSTCAALTANATDGCGTAKANLYLWSAGALSLVNLLPAQSAGTPGAQLGAQSTAVSSNGSRVYFTDGTNLYLRAAGQTKQVDAAALGGGTFETATPDGAFAFFTKGGHLWRYGAGADAATDLTPGGGVVGVLGASADGTRVYFKDAALKLWSSGTTTTVAAAADADNYPPVTGTARVSADGTKLLFGSTAALPTTGGATYDNTDLTTKAPDAQLYLYDAAGATLRCVSCNPANSRPMGPSLVPGAIANGTAPGSPHLYKPRVMSGDGRRVFFESRDALSRHDANVDFASGDSIPDVYQWRASGVGGCGSANGCVELLSSGRVDEAATLIDASQDGSDVFFLTRSNLVGADHEAADLYDARVGGGFAEPLPSLPCVADACQIVRGAVDDPVLTTTLAGPGNGPERYRTYARGGKCTKAKRAKGKCKGQKKGKAKRGSRG